MKPASVKGRRGSVMLVRATPEVLEALSEQACDAAVQLNDNKHNSCVPCLNDTPFWFLGAAMTVNVTNS